MFNMNGFQFGFDNFNASSPPSVPKIQSNLKESQSFNFNAPEFKFNNFPDFPMMNNPTKTVKTKPINIFNFNNWNQTQATEKPNPNFKKQNQTQAATKPILFNPNQFNMKVPKTVNLFKNIKPIQNSGNTNNAFASNLVNLSVSPQSKLSNISSIPNLFSNSANFNVGSTITTPTTFMNFTGRKLQSYQNNYSDDPYSYSYYQPSQSYRGS